MAGQAGERKRDDSALSRVLRAAAGPHKTIKIDVGGEWETVNALSAEEVHFAMLARMTTKPGPPKNVLMMWMQVEPHKFPGLHAEHNLDIATMEGKTHSV